MPKLSDTMVEGVVAEWHKKLGDSVAEGDLWLKLKQIKRPWNLSRFMMEFYYTLAWQKVPLLLLIYFSNYWKTR